MRERERERGERGRPLALPLTVILDGVSELLDGSHSPSLFDPDSN